MDREFDLIILGGGIAGMTAAIYAARANLKTVILEERVCGGLVNSTHVVENFPSYPSINGMDLMEKVREHVDQLGAEVIEVVEIEQLDLQSDLKTVDTDEGSFKAPAVIIATGRTPRPLPIEHDFEQVHYCAICDGSGYQGKNVLVVGGGNSGVDESLYLLGLGVRKLTLIEEMDKLFASETACAQLKSKDNVEIHISTRLSSLHGEDRLRGVSLENIHDGSACSRDIDGIFVYIGQQPKTTLFAGQLELDTSGYVKVDAEMRTSTPGIFGAGDVIQKRYRQITTAMGDATIAALSAVEYLTAKKSDRP